MTNNINTKIIVSREAGVLFDSTIISDFISLNNYKYIDFVISSGIGSAGNTSVSIQGRNGNDGTAKSVSCRYKQDGMWTNVIISKSVSIGGTAGNCDNHVFRITADDLADDEFDQVAIKTTAVSNSSVPGCIIAICYEPRYTE